MPARRRPLLPAAAAAAALPLPPPLCRRPPPPPLCFPESPPLELIAAGRLKGALEGALKGALAWVAPWPQGRKPIQKQGKPEYRFAEGLAEHVGASRCWLQAEPLLKKWFGKVDLQGVFKRLVC